MAAKRDGKRPFTYVDLTHSTALPDFLPPEAVGGKTLMPGNDEVLSGYTGSIAQLDNGTQKFPQYGPVDVRFLAICRSSCLC